MKDKTFIALGRMACGAAIFITSIVTGHNSTYQLVALILLGVPFEALAKEKP